MTGIRIRNKSRFSDKWMFSLDFQQQVLSKQAWPVASVADKRSECSSQHKNIALPWGVVVVFIACSPPQYLIIPCFLSLPVTPFSCSLVHGHSPEAINTLDSGSKYIHSDLLACSFGHFLAHQSKIHVRGDVSRAVNVCRTESQSRDVTEKAQSWPSVLCARWQEVKPDWMLL